eukprot:GDKK01022923.1.p1 GENE.GDKK01022923.1~~GDKK01022923.1.p1  ORF type:complete len:152 (-),score=42.85 GDKK01022923.1:24-422(-)
MGNDDDRIADLEEAHKILEEEVMLLEQENKSLQEENDAITEELTSLKGDFELALNKAAEANEKINSFEMTVSKLRQENQLLRDETKNVRKDTSSTEVAKITENMKTLDNDNQMLNAQIKVLVNQLRDTEENL